MLGLVIREVFHFIFLERLLVKHSQDSFVLKGGVNLRFFFQSPRYSEDMDLDVKDVPIHRLKEDAYRILEDQAFRRNLRIYGIQDIKINDPAKAKKTETTQRFRMRLVAENGQEFPTKIKFSRRGLDGDSLYERIDTGIAQKYQKLSYLCRHYSGQTAVLQKVRALSKRSTPQARDVFDLHVLLMGGHAKREALYALTDKHIVKSACERLMDFTFYDYRDQVVEFLNESDRHTYGKKNHWEALQENVLEFLNVSL